MAVHLSTSPNDPPTHWKQVRLLLKAPIAVRPGDVITGCCSFAANESRHYDIRITVSNTNTFVAAENIVTTDNYALSSTSTYRLPTPPTHDVDADASMPAGDDEGAQQQARLGKRKMPADCG